MDVLGRLATALNRRDEVPNQELAKEIAEKDDDGAVQELIDGLSNLDRNIQNDCIKVLYEIGERKPELIAPFYKEFAGLLESKNNRLAWGAMTALDYIASIEPKRIHAMLGQIIAAANNGSVITRDHAVCILVKLGSTKQHAEECVPLVIDQLKACPGNQFPMYVEMCLHMVTEKNKSAFQTVISRRLPEFEKESQKKRISRVLKKMGAKIA